MKSKFTRKQHKKYKPSHKHVESQLELDLNEQQKACNLLKQQSYFAFDDVNNQQQNIFLRISPRESKIFTQMKIRHTQKVNKLSNKSTVEKSLMSLTNIRNTTLPNVNRQNNSSNRKEATKQHSKNFWLQSPSKSPIGKLPINLTQYVIVDSRNSPISPSVSYSATFLHQKYTKAIQQILKQRQIQKNRETNMSNYSRSNSPTKRNRSLNLKRATNQYLNNFIIN